MTSLRSLWTRGAAGLLAAVALAACGGADAPTAVDAPKPTTIEIVSAAATSGAAGMPLSAAPTFQVKDQRGAAMGGVAVSVAVTAGGGSLVSAPAVSAAGPTPVGTWTLGTTLGANTLTISAAGLAPQTVTVNGTAGAPASIAVVSGGGQSVPAGRAVSPVAFVVRDRFDNPVGGVAVTFSVVGGGSLAATSGATSDGGVVLAPTWTLGKSVVPQQLRVTAGTATGAADAAVQSGFNISVRFFGAPMTESQQALFTNAAARISAIITGDLPNVNATGFDLDAGCGVTGQGIMSEVVDDVVIYAYIGAIDGPGKVLAQAGPCAFRSTAAGALPVIGVMEFDEADLASMAGAGSLQDVITHEMMHVLGFGDTYFDYFHFLSNANTATVSFTGPRGLAGCRTVGGSLTCASSVPLENSGGEGTAGSHWRESVFRTELMTGYANAGGMPISAMTVGAFEDLGYQVNYDARDSYLIPGGSLSASSASGSTGTHAVVTGEGWERRLPGPGTVIAGPGIFQTLPPRAVAVPRLTTP